MYIYASKSTYSVRSVSVSHPWDGRSAFEIAPAFDDQSLRSRSVIALSSLIGEAGSRRVGPRAG